MRPLTFGMAIVCTSRRGGLFCACASGAIENSCIKAEQMIATLFIRYLCKTCGFETLGRVTLLGGSLLHGEDSKFRGLPATRGNRQEETMHAFTLPPKIAGSSSAQSRGNPGEQSVMVGIGHLKNVNYAFSTGNIHTFVLGVIVKIIRVLGARQGHDKMTGSCVKHCQTGGLAYTYEQPMIRLVKRHGEL